MPTIAAAFLSFCAALLAALLTHLLAERRKRRDELAEMRLRAYTDFLSAASRIAAARRLGSPTDEVDDLVKLNDAKVRMCICGSSGAVAAMAEFWQEGGTLELEGELLAFSRLCRRMREDLGNKVNDNGTVDLSSTLFKLRPSSYSYKLEKQQSKHLRTTDGDA